jgi:hypothetical protein
MSIDDTSGRREIGPRFVLNFGGWRGTPRIKVVVSEQTYQEWYRRVFGLADDCTHPIDEHWWHSHHDINGQTCSVSGWADLP